MANEINLHEVSIKQLFMEGEKCTFQVPIYQRNYAWEKDEIEALVNDVYDAFYKDATRNYYIGTLVSYRREDNVFEIIDGQQRLTTIRIILKVLDEKIQNKLIYRARKKSEKTLENLNRDALKDIDESEKDSGIEKGFEYAEEALKGIKEDEKYSSFKTYFLNNVHIIHYIVPRDIDLNHYFEVMNSRGEQLEKHEIVKAKLMSHLSDSEKSIFNKIWQACSKMSVYIQDSLDFQIKDKKVEDAKSEIFGENWNSFKAGNFDFFNQFNSEDNANQKSIDGILKETSTGLPSEKEEADTFQPIIDFPNFLLIVLKITLLIENGKVPSDFALDDKTLLNAFKDIEKDSDLIKNFAFNLLKAKFFLDNYIVHHSNEDETSKSNPWQLQTYVSDNKKQHLKNLCNDEEGSPSSKNREIQDNLIQLLSMFEVSFTARQRKNYLFYCLYYLLKNDFGVYDFSKIEKYANFIERLADSYFFDVYLVESNLNKIHTPMPDKFDATILTGENCFMAEPSSRSKNDFETIFGNGEKEESKGIPLFIFNYLDYKIWKLYAKDVRGKELKEGSSERNRFFKEYFGCSDFGLDVFNDFYFSRTRRSLEHFYPQANATGEKGHLNKNEINCLGNYAMIGSEANSSGSNWSPKAKLDHYLDESGKINLVSVSSLKFRIMMQICDDNSKFQEKKDHEWEFDDIQRHQEKMLDILLQNRA